ncbi:MAG: DUF1059 domain-containing protein [Patescibacteria group bacterium]|jgi:predicted small metal-binding protein
MYTLACKDIGDGSSDCHYVSKGEDVNGVISDMTAHANSEHAEEVKKMMENMTEDEMVSMMKTKVKTV